MGRPPAERRLLLDAWLGLALARLMLEIVPFRRVARRLGRAHETSTAHLTPEQRRVASAVGWAVTATARYTPWTSNCLLQALAARRMLRARAIPATLYLGVARENASDLKGHAWIRCGDMVLTGDGGLECYAVVATFATTALPRGADARP